MTSPFVVKQTELLIQGLDGYKVVENLRRYFKTVKSFEKNISNVRRCFLQEDIRGEFYTEDLNKAFEMANNTSDLSKKEEALSRLTIFQNLKVAEQYDVLKKREFILDFHELNNHMNCFRLLPQNLKTFSMSRAELESCKEEKKKTLLYSNCGAIQIQSISDILEFQIDVLRNGSKIVSHEILALLLVSGRRECEILNGKSTFETIQGHPNHIRFTGVLKKKEDVFHKQTSFEKSVVIPLLCSCDLFMSAFDRLRQRQKPDILCLTNKEVTQRYSSSLSAAQKTVFPMIEKVHHLRQIYAKFVDIMFEHDVSFPLLCMFALSHDVIEDSLFYSRIKIQNEKVYENVNGALEIKKFGKMF